MNSIVKQVKAAHAMKAQATLLAATEAAATQTTVKLKLEDDQRQLVVLQSASLKQCWLTARNNYSLRTPELIVARARKRLAINCPKLAELAEAADLCAVVVSIVTKDTAGAAKATQHDIMLQCGYTVLSTRAGQ